jgi:hypothetical protein
MRLCHWPCWHWLAPIGVVIALLSGCAANGKTGAETADSSEELPIPPDLTALVSSSAQIGHQLYLIDKASAIATDTLLEAKVDLRSSGIAGYLPLQEGTQEGKPLPSFLVTFFTRDTPPKTAYEVRVGPNIEPTIEAFEPPEETSPDFAPLIRARQTALNAASGSTQPLNPVIVPGSVLGEEGHLVYLIAATNRPNVAVFGQHFRALVSTDGKDLISFTALSKAMLEIPYQAQADSASLMVTHIVTDYPLETHVFTSLLLGIEVYVGTQRGVWRINGDRIAFLGN